MKSLCGNSYGCLSDVDGAIGTELDYTGARTCSRCESMAKAIVEFFIGEEIEFVTALDEWVKKSEIMERLLDTVLGQALHAQGII